MTTATVLPPLKNPARKSREVIQQKPEPRDLAALECIIRKALAFAWNNSVAIGFALEEIRTRKLYLSHYTNFELYCRETWNFSRMTASRHVRFAAVTRALQLEGKPMPKSEREALALLPPKKERKAKPETPEAETPSRPGKWDAEIAKDSAIPTLEDGSQPDQSERNYLGGQFKGAPVLVRIEVSETPGRWEIRLLDATFEQVMRVARLLKE
jgi:hypothetical protein